MSAHRCNTLRDLLPLCALAVACAVAGDAAAAVLEAGAAHAAAHSAGADAYAARIAAAPDAGTLLHVARAALADDTLSPPARERVLYASLMALAAAGADVATETDVSDLLARLAGRKPQVQVWQYDGPERVPVPLYDVAGAARYAQRRLAERATQQQASDAIAQGADRPLLQYDTPSSTPSAQRAILQAFEQAPARALLAYRDRYYPDLADGRHAAIAAVVARRLGDAVLMRAALARADGVTALAIVRRVRDSLDEDAALDVLAAASARADVASAALFEIGRLLPTQARAQALLVAALADDYNAGSAAAALATAHDPALASRLSAWVRAQADTRLARRGILALRLDASPAARTALAALAADPQVAPALRREAAR